ncbi:MAG: cell division protein FtsQ/DivIB [Gammaproteobacteria bacterium]|nr:cell division protein FtsQ/DivIB [Gammaproteobacteria bacterium]
MAAPTRRQRTPRTAAPRWTRHAAGLGVLLMLAGAAAAGYHYLSQPGRMPLRVVEVSGQFRHLTTAAIRDTAGAAIDGGFFTCDMQKLRNAVLAMPWVADVSVRRVWPDRLQMRVSERTPLARWGDDALLGSDATVFSPDNRAAYAALVRLAGPHGSALRVAAFYRRAQRAAQLRDLQILELTLDARRHWWIRFADGLTVSLGREHRDARLAQFLRVYPRLVADPARRPARVDMRYAHGFAVQWRAAENAEDNPADNKIREKV